MIAATETSVVETPANRIVYDLPAEEYHRKVLGVASKSMLDIINKSPAHYYDAVVNGTEKEDTDALRFGRIFDEYVLELPKALEKYQPEGDYGDLRTTKAKEAKAEFRAQHVGKEFVSAEEWDRVRRMGDAVHKHPIAARLLRDGKTQASAFCIDPETGLQRKSRLDIWCPSVRVIADIKTTEDASPRKFAKSCHEWRYHVQNCFYVDSMEIITGKPVKAFLFIAVEKKHPHPVAVYQLDQAAIDLGREQYQANMRTLAECLERDEWPGYSQGIEELSLPRWAFTGA